MIWILICCILGVVHGQVFPGFGGSGDDDEGNQFQSLGRATVNQTTKHGCVCLSQCDETFDAFVPWCYTSVPGERPDLPCGFYSTSRRAYWDECVLNKTGPVSYYDKYEDIWAGLIETAIPTGAVPFFCVGVGIAYPLIAVHGLWWAAIIPFVYGFYGAFAVFIPVAVLAIGIAQIYLAMPYAPPIFGTGWLGVAIALPVVYYHLGRHIDPMRQVVSGQAWLQRS